MFSWPHRVVGRRSWGWPCLENGRWWWRSKMLKAVRLLVMPRVQRWQCSAWAEEEIMGGRGWEGERVVPGESSMQMLKSPARAEWGGEGWVTEKISHKWDSESHEDILGENAATRGFSGSPLLRLPSQCRGPGPTPGQGARSHGVTKTQCSQINRLMIF